MFKGDHLKNYIRHEIKFNTPITREASNKGVVSGGLASNFSPIRTSSSKKKICFQEVCMENTWNVSDGSRVLRG